MKWYQPGTWWGMGFTQLVHDGEFNDGVASLKVMWLWDYETPGLQQQQEALTTDLGDNSQGPPRGRIRRTQWDLDRGGQAAQDAAPAEPQTRPQPGGGHRCPTSLSPRLLPYHPLVSHQPNPAGSQPAGSRAWGKKMRVGRVLHIGNNLHINYSIFKFYLFYLFYFNYTNNTHSLKKKQRLDPSG